MTKVKVDELTIEGVVYVPKELINKLATSVDGLRMCMVRTYSAGIHFGYLKKQDGKQVELINSRRVWYWSGANSISQLAVEGSTKISECKIAMELPELILTEAIEIIPMTEKSIENLKSAKVWKM
jgi:hypothetical protein